MMPLACTCVSSNTGEQTCGKRHPKILNMLAMIFESGYIPLSDPCRLIRSQIRMMATAVSGAVNPLSPGATLGATRTNAFEESGLAWTNREASEVTD
jgi:hypothetical protein